MSFWEQYKEWTGPAKAKPIVEEKPSAQNVTTGVCDFCHLAGDDVLIGVCADCAGGAA